MYFLYHTLIFVVLNYKVLANFSSGYPVTITRDYPVHNTFCWVFPIRDASLTCPGVTVLFKKIGGNLKNFAIQLGDLGGRGEEFSKVAQSPPSNLCVCAPVNAWRWHSHNIHLEPGVCAYVNIWRWCNNLHLQLCMCAHVHAWRWHSDTATISIFNCVCVLMSMLISTLKHVLMSMLGSGIATILILTRECVCVCQ